MVDTVYNFKKIKKQKNLMLILKKAKDIIGAWSINEKDH